MVASIFASQQPAFRGGAPTLSLDFTSTLDSRVTASGGANGTRVNSSGLIEAATAPRFDHDSITLEKLGVLIEEARTNLFTYSDDFTNAAWDKATGWSAATGNATTSPYGTTTAARISDINDAGTGAVFVYNGNKTVSVSSPYTISIFQKPDQLDWTTITLFGFTAPNGAAFFNSATGETGTPPSGVTPSVDEYASGWMRNKISYTSHSSDTVGQPRFQPADGDGDTTVSRNGTSSVYMFGPQMEAGAFATSYIPTSASTVTRSADVLTMTGTDFSDWYNQTEGTFVFTCDSPGIGTRVIAQVDDNSADNRITLWTDDDTLMVTIVDGGVSQAAITVGTIFPGVSFRVALSYRENDIAVSLNGGTAVTDTSATIPTVDRLRLGHDTTGNYLCGHIKEMTYYDAWQ